MSIENDSRIADQQDSIRQIQELQEQQNTQELQDDQQRLQQQQTEEIGEATPGGQAELEKHELDSSDETQRAEDMGVGDVQAQVQAQQVAEVNESRELNGDDKSLEAVDTASVQQDRGESWQQFMQDEDSRADKLRAVEEKSLQNQSSGQQDPNQINMQDLLKQMTIQSGKING